MNSWISEIEMHCKNGNKSSTLVDAATAACILSLQRLDIFSVTKNLKTWKILSIMTSASTQERLKSVGNHTKSLINGYIRSSQFNLFGDIVNENPYYNIPGLIHYHIMLFYEAFTWYKEKYGDGLKFISDTEVKLEKNPGEHEALWPTCLFGNELSDTVCDKFSISFKIKAFGSDPDFEGLECCDFYIGYLFGNTNDTIPSSITNWYDQLGQYSIKNTSYSWGFYKNELKYSHGETVWHQVENDCESEWKIGDIIRLLFDFKKKKVRVYHNDKQRDCVEMKGTNLWIGLSFHDNGSQIEMIDYKYD